MNVAIADPPDIAVTAYIAGAGSVVSVTCAWPFASVVDDDALNEPPPATIHVMLALATRFPN